MVIQPNLSIEDIGPRDSRMLHGETCRVTEDGHEVLGEFPRELIVV